MISTRRITVDGLSTSVLVGGNGTPGEAVVFVHGNPDSGSDWMPLMTRVAEFASVVAPSAVRLISPAALIWNQPLGSPPVML
jgi:pimeloyl-ACP methyl ester carboxylesterase